MNRKRLLIGGLAAAIAFGAASAALGATLSRSIDVTYRNISVRVDGQTIQSDTEPFIVNATGRTVVPARALAEALGASVGWDESTSTVQVYSNRHADRTWEGERIRHRVPAAKFELLYPGTFTAVQPGLLSSKLSLVRGPTTFHVFSEQAAEGATAAEFADFALGVVGQRFKGLVVSDRKTLNAYGTEVVETTVEWPVDGVTLRGTARLFVAGGNGWALIGLAEKNSFSGLQAELKAIFDSFALLP